MTPRSRSPFLVLAMGLLAACGGATGPELPPVATIALSPENGSLDLGGTLRITAVALSEEGDTIPEAVLSWQSTTGAATVDGTGLVTGVAPGLSHIEVSADGAMARATVVVSPVADVVPDSGRYGAVVTLIGDDVLADADVAFSGADGEAVPAVIRSATPGRLEAWVPVGAVTGPLRLSWPGGAAWTAREFERTAAADVLSGGATIPFPYQNPSLLADGRRPHAVSFSLPDAGPFTLDLVNRGSRSEYSAVRAWLFRTDVQPSTLMAFLMTQDLAADTAYDTVTYARSLMPAGDYTLMVAPLDLADPERVDLTRAFGLRMEPGARFDRPPDSQEPDDFPAEATALDLPFDADDVGGLGFETPYGMDHVAFELGDSTTITLSSVASDALVLLYLFPADVTDILEAWDTDQVLAAAEGDVAVQTLTATLPAGRYIALAWNWGAGARPYHLEIGEAGTAAGEARATPFRHGNPLLRAAVSHPWRPTTTLRTQDGG